MPKPDKFVVVHNRSRDGYQVAAALAEAGLLERLVTDFYAPKPLLGLSGFFARRHHPAIPWRDANSVWSSFAAQYAAQLLRLPMNRVFAFTDRLLAGRAAAVARSTGSAMLCYSSYMPSRHQSAGSLVVDFEYHPHPGSTFNILERDRARFPETGWSFARELHDHRRTVHDEPWRQADRVICASSMTRRSLEEAGCDPSKIRVVPYGFGEAEDVTARQLDECRFLFVGQGIQRKGLHHLIRAWQARPRRNASLTLVSYQVDPGIVALIESPDIRLLPRRSPDELAALYRAADVFIMPSLVEGFGLVYLEALARGCHVVGTSNTGLPDLQLDAGSATIVAPGAIEQIDAAITELISRKLSHSLDPQAIAGESRKWRWPDFRRAVAELCAAELAAWNARS